MKNYFASVLAIMVMTCPGPVVFAASDKGLEHGNPHDVPSLDSGVVTDIPVVTEAPPVDPPVVETPPAQVPAVVEPPPVETPPVAVQAPQPPSTPKVSPFSFSNSQPSSKNSHSQGKGGPINTYHSLDEVIGKINRAAGALNGIRDTSGHAAKASEYLQQALQELKAANR